MAMKLSVNSNTFGKKSAAMLSVQIDYYLVHFCWRNCAILATMAIIHHLRSIDHSQPAPPDHIVQTGTLGNLCSGHAQLIVFNSRFMFREIIWEVEGVCTYLIIRNK